MEKAFYGNNPRVISLSDEVIEKANLNTIEKVYRRLFNGVSGATLTIVGNVNLETLKPLVETYFGSLPKGKAFKANKKEIIKIASGVNDKVVELEMETPKSSVVQLYSSYMPVDTKTDVALSVASYILDMIYTKEIREKEGGTYGVGTGMFATWSPLQRALIQIRFDTNPEQAEKLSSIATRLLKEFAQNGPTASEMDMAVGNLKKNLTESRISNPYWMEIFEKWNDYNVDYDTEYEKALENITSEDIKNVLQAILSTENFIQLKSMPAAK